MELIMMMMFRARCFLVVVVITLLLGLFSSIVYLPRNTQAQVPIDPGAAYVFLPRSTCNYIKTPGETFDILLNLSLAHSSVDTSDLNISVSYQQDDLIYEYSLEVMGFASTDDPYLWSLSVEAPGEMETGFIYDLEVVLGLGQTLSEPRCIQFIDSYKSDFKVMHLTDVHIDFVSTSILQPVPSAQEIMDKVVREVNVINPDLLLVTGDLVFKGHGSGPGISMEEQFRWYREAVMALDSPVMTAIGNHEVMWNADVEETSATYQENIGPLHYAFDYGNVHFILLNSTSNFMGDSRTEGGFSAVELAYCEEQLESIPSGELTFVAYHHDRNALLRGGGPEMMALFKDYNDKVEFVLNGHSHREVVEDINGTNYIQTISAAEYNAAPGNGYRLLTIENGEVTDYAYADSSNECINYNQLNHTITSTPADASTAAVITVTNNQEQGYRDCQIKASLDKGDGERTYTGVNCTVERTVITGTRDLVYVSFNLDDQSVKNMAIEFSETPSTDDDTQDDDVVDDDSGDDDVENHDQDGDTLPDWYETEFFGDLSQGPEDDYDGDGYTNFEEYVAGTDPVDADDPPKEEEGENGSDNALVYVLVAILIIIILFVIFIVVIRMKKKRLAKEEDDDK
jgi:predicted MPP superfamily phosphohydrolase